ncbi:MAG: histidine phosphatase family protein [Pseudomonadota bacterium]
MRLILVRHGITLWNQEKRIQGHSDQPLCEVGVAEMTARQLPNELRTLAWYCSPLSRATQSATLLGLKHAAIEPRLIEMDWGDWEGHILKPLRKKIGQPMRDNEARGVDFRPPGGESPRDVQRRVQEWARTAHKKHDQCGAVVHKGIIRCVYALAKRWDMRGDSPIQFDWTAAHEFECDDDGAFSDHHRAIQLAAN